MSDGRRTAVVLQASGPNGLAIVRALGRAGVPVVAADDDPWAIGLRSRWARPHALPDPLADAGAFVDGLLALGARLGDRPVLFPTHDETLNAIGAREAEVDALFARPWTAWERHERIMDKLHQHEVARSIGFPVPRTITPRDEADVAGAAADLRFPVVIKPGNDPAFRRRIGRQLIRAESPADLLRAWDQVGGPGLHISEAIPGGDDHLWALCSYRDVSGRPLASWTGRKLRQWPPDFGTGRAVEARWDPAYAARGHELLDALGLHGMSHLETKLDPRDGRQYLIEVNARSWLFIDAAVVSGVDIPMAAYLDAVGTPRSWATPHRSGVRWILATRHIPAGIAEVARGRWSARALAGSLRPPVHEGLLSLTDPMPAVAVARRQILWVRRAVTRDRDHHDVG